MPFQYQIPISEKKKLIKNNSKKIYVGLFIFLFLLSGNFSLQASEKNERNSYVIQKENLSDIEEVIRKNKSKRLIFVGEDHTSLSDHHLQLKVMKAMKKQGKNFVVGVEWFQRPFQVHLDDYISGKVNEENFLRQSEYFNRWGFDFRYYREILEYARKHKIRILALNASRELTKEISKKGLRGLSSERRSLLPASYDFSNKDYIKRLKEIFEMHGHQKTRNSKAFQRFLEVQLTWDETMASEISKFLRKNEKQRILVFAGRGHTHKAAIPNRVNRRIGINGISIASYQPNDPFFPADYLVLQPEKKLPPAGLIGIDLEERQNNLYIRSITRDVTKEPFNLMVNDRITKILDIEVSKYSDVKLSMIDKKPGEKIIVEVMRFDKNGNEKILKKEIILIGENPNPH